MYKSYDGIKEIMNGIIKHGYFSQFADKKVYYFTDNHNNRAFVQLTEQGFKGLYCIHIFYNESSLNYMHDVLISKDDDLLYNTYGMTEELILAVESKEDVDELDKLFLKNMGSRTKEENNYIIYSFKRGEGYSIANFDEVDTFISWLEVLYSMYRNNYKELISFANQEENGFEAILVDVDKDLCNYVIEYATLPKLERMPKKRKCFKSFKEEYETKEKNAGECVLMFNYLPSVVLETNNRVGIINTYYKDSDEGLSTYVYESIKDYNKVIFGMLDHLFANIGVPSKIIINDRILYSSIARTMEELGIEIEFTKDLPEYVDFIKEPMISMLKNVIDRVLPKFIIEKVLSKINELEYDKFDEILASDDLFDKDKSEDDDLDELGLLDSDFDNSTDLVS